MADTTDTQGNDGVASATEQVTTNVPEPTSRGTAPGWLIPTLVIAGVLCGYAGEWAISATQSVYYTPAESSGFTATPEEVQQLKEDMTRNFAVGFAAFGAIIMSVTGLIVGLSQSLVRSIVGLVVGAVLGLVAGGILGASTFLTDTALKLSTTEGLLQEGLVQIVLIFGPSYLVFCVVASTLAAALCLESRPMGHAIGTGIKAAVVSMLLYAAITFIIPLLSAGISWLIGAVTSFTTPLFMVGYPDQIWPENMSIRYAAYGIMALGTALAAGFVVSPRSSKNA